MTHTELKVGDKLCYRFYEEDMTYKKVVYEVTNLDKPYNPGTGDVPAIEVKVLSSDSIRSKVDHLQCLSYKFLVVQSGRGNLTYA
jgi:hypothetical protein